MRHLLIVGVAAVSSLCHVASTSSNQDFAGMVTTNVASAPFTGQEKPSAGSKVGDLDLKSIDIVAFSSRMIAAARAIESRREDRLFNDPFAELLAGPEAMQKVADRQPQTTDPQRSDADRDRSVESVDETAEREKGPSSSSRRLAIRTRFCDDYFENCAGARGIKQIVSLGAGMDTRGLRLNAPKDATVFDVDQAQVLRVKKGLLMKARADGTSLEGREEGASRARIVGVEADLSQIGWEGELFEAGFDPALPSAWILEGLTMYLEEKELVRLIEVLAGLCTPGSAFCATCVSSGSVARGKSGSQLMSTWKWGSDDPQSFFDARFPAGWSFKSVTCGTPGQFPTGADYSVGFQGKGPAYVIGYSSGKGSSSSQSDEL
ncbi:unnamed protein product [Ascophyllum nodosum]